MSKQPTIDSELVDRALDLAGGCYVERDGGDYYVLTANADRLGDSFKDRADTRKFLCWLGGDPIPAGWEVATHGSSYDATIMIPGGRQATIWLRAVAKRFPNWRL